MKEDMLLFNVEIKKISIKYENELDGSIEDYFTLYKKPNDEYGLVWNKETPTKIRHEITELSAKCFVQTAI